MVVKELASLAHEQTDLDAYGDAARDIFAILAGLSEADLLETPVAHSGFHRLTKE